MSRDYPDDEQQTAAEQELFDSHALQRPISELPPIRPVVCFPPTAIVADALQAMTEKRVGCVLVVEDDKLTGVFSERDVLLKVAGADLDVNSTPLSNLMTKNPQTLRADHELVYALHQMAVGGYRHVPILDSEGRPVAVVSMRDIVEHIVSLYPDEVLKLPPSPDRSIPQPREGA